MIKFKKRTCIYILYIFCLVALAEALIRWDGRFYQFTELMDSSYFQDLSMYTRKKIFVHSPNIIDRECRSMEGEFVYSVSTNSLGLRDIEHSLKKESNEFRIVCLGDSFTEGYGVDFEYTWPQQLGKQLNKQGGPSKITVVNAGIDGSDPFFCYYRLKHLLLPLKPDLVLLQINSSDMENARCYGGFERFDNQSLNSLIKQWPYNITSFSEKAPDDISRYVFHRWSLWKLFLEACCKRSHLARGLLWGLLDMHSGCLDTYEDMDNIYEQYKTLLYEFDQLGKASNFQFLSIFLPFLPELFESNSTDWRRLLETALPESQILNTFPLFSAMSREEKQSLYWSLDSHFNEKGYRVFAEQVAQFLIKSQLVPVETD